MQDYIRIKRMRAMPPPPSLHPSLACPSRSFFLSLLPLLSNQRRVLVATTFALHGGVRRRMVAAAALVYGCSSIKHLDLVVNDNVRAFLPWVQWGVADLGRFFRAVHRALDVVRHEGRALRRGGGMVGKGAALDLDGLYHLDLCAAGRNTIALAIFRAARFPPRRVVVLFSVHLFPNKGNVVPQRNAGPGGTKLRRRGQIGLQRGRVGSFHCWRP
jgi:hypothetical protein